MRTYINQSQHFRVTVHFVPPETNPLVRTIPGKDLAPIIDAWEKGQIVEFPGLNGGEIMSLNPQHILMILREAVE